MARVGSRHRSPRARPGTDDSDWNWTLADVGELTDLDDGMVYAMALSGGIAIPDAPATTVEHAHC